MAQYEWYVPTDKGQREYWQVLVKNCPTQKDRDDFTLRYNNVWEELALKSGFNDDDIFAREEMEDFYNNRNGWEDEQFFSMDKLIVEWCILVHKHARGIQVSPDKFKIR